MAGRRGVAAVVVLSFVLGGALPASAAELGVARSSVATDFGLGFGSGFAFYAKKKKKPPAEDPGPRLTPESAEPKRQAIRDAVQSSRDSGDFAAVADGLERNAAQLGDPVTMLEAAEARLEAAKKDRSKATAEASIETSRRALDMLHFYAAVASGEATSDWLVIDPAEAGGLIERGDGIVTDAEGLIEEIEAEQDASGAAAPVADEKKKKKKKRKKGEAKPGTGMIAAGSIFTVVGVAGVSMVIAGTVISASKQNEVEKFNQGDPEVDKLDDEGKRANLIAYIGAGVAVAGFAVGIPLLVLGVKKRKAGGGPPATATTRSSLVVAPAFGAGIAAISLRGRF